MKITNWPLEERPREKLLAYGAHTLSDAELLAVLIHTGTKDTNAVQLARNALNEFGSIRALLNAQQANFVKTKGFGTAKYATLLACTELNKRSLAQTMKRDVAFTEAEQTAKYLMLELRDRSSEVFCMLMLDSQHQLIAFREMFKGTINSAAVYPRELVKQAIADNAAAVILAHNHPSGIAEPSQADIQITQRIKDAMQLVDVRVLDHFVIGDCQSVSFAQRGLL